MINKVLSNIKEHNLILENDNVVVGVSGGPDSMALLYVLLEQKKTLNFQMFVCHVNHGVRGDDALSDRIFVEEKARELGLPFYYVDVDMKAYAKEMKITAEEAGRKLRYGFFRDVLESNGGGKIAVAHNKNDQAETLLLRIMRGTGIDGIRGMDFVYRDIIRPLLNVSRAEIEHFICTEDIETVLDKTNLLPIYNRNKVRLELLPYMIKNFNPNIIDTLWRLSRTADLDTTYLNKITEEKYKLIVKNQLENSIILDSAMFNKEDRCIRLRLLRKAIFNLKGSIQGIAEVHLDSLEDLFRRSETGKGLQLPNGLVGRISYNDLIIEMNVLDSKAYEHYIYEGGNFFKELGIYIYVYIVEGNKIIKGKSTRSFDFDSIKGTLKIRNRRNGDRFKPHGLKGTKKLKDYFIDNKVDKDLRDRIPLLVDDENIIWVMGYATSETHKVTDKTRKILVVDYKEV
ncbi:tRNA lysidine(34) synthetase TilS [Tissierella creatinini]|nr:tRNA lysidine(34) synthetase TilS [Tissierella creatinini]TJX63717.1 tRNA lysidine(34) synthetase TilS [Soehngenia saccharolytica]